LRFLVHDRGSKYCGPFDEVFRDTTTQRDIDRGTVVVEVGVAPLRPAKSVVIRIRRGRQ
jgi:phage tail sheath protein FI